MKYQEIQNEVYRSKYKCLVESTEDFQCPASGWGCVIKWDIENGKVWAEMCEDGIWNIKGENFTEEIKQTTIEWCEKFGIQNAYSDEQANTILDIMLGEESVNYYFGIGE